MTLTDIDQKTIRDVPRSAMPGLTPDLIAAGMEIHVNSVHPPRASLVLSLPQNVLARIEILLFYPFSAGDAVAELGSPDYIGYQQMGVEDRTCKIVFMWQAKQLVLDSVPEVLGNSSPQSNCDTLRATGKIPPDAMIQDVIYMTMPWMAELRKDDGSEYYRFAGFIATK